MDKKLEKEILIVIQRILPKISDELKLELLNMPEENLSLYHFGLGTWIRTFVLRNERVIYKLFLKNGICHKDDMSEIIVRELHEYLKIHGNKK